MIEPTDEDIGRRVIYQPDGTGGTLASYTDHYAFVTWDVTKVEIVQKEIPREPAPPIGIDDGVSNALPAEDPGYDIEHEQTITVVAGDHPSPTNFNEVDWA
jgi:hypothetical protein